MFTAIFIVIAVFSAAADGQAMLAALTSAPYIGGAMTWYVNLVGEPLITGASPLTANLLSGMLAVQIVVMLTWPLRYGPAMVRACLRSIRAIRTT